MFQSNMVPASPLPSLSAYPDTPLSEALSIGASGEPLDILDIPSNGTPMSEGDNLSEAFNSSQSPLLDAAAHTLEDPEAHDAALPR